MLTKSITKLIDEAVIPAVLLILAKLLGLFLSALFLKVNFEIQKGGILGVLPQIAFLDIDSYKKAENLSNLVLFTVAALGTIYILIKLHFLHESHVAPKLQARLAKVNLEKLISPSFHLYHQSLIWLIFLWLTFVFLLISTLANITHPIITVIAFLISSNLTWIFSLDVEREIRIVSGKT